MDRQTDRIAIANMPSAVPASTAVMRKKYGMALHKCYISIGGSQKQYKIKKCANMQSHKNPNLEVIQQYILLQCTTL